MLRKGMTNPLVALIDMAQARGNFSRRVSSTNYHEITTLSQLFNSMAGQLDSTIRQLKTSEHELGRKLIELDERHRKHHSVIQTLRPQTNDIYI